MRFDQLDTKDAVTFLATTEDGRFLAAAHESKDAVTIWDMASGTKVASLATATPRHLLSRGRMLYVANIGKGTISVFSQLPGWKLTSQIKAGDNDICYLSAPHGEHFDGRLLSTSFQHDGNSTVFLIDTRQNLTTKLCRRQSPIVATWDGSGKSVFEQGRFASVYTVGSYAAVDYLAGGQGDRRKPTTFQRDPSVPYLEPAAGDAGVWVGGTGLYRGNPPELVRPWVGMMAVADATRPAAYAVGHDSISAFRADEALTPLGSMAVEIPEALRGPASKQEREDQDQKRIRFSQKRFDGYRDVKDPLVPKNFHADPFPAVAATLGSRTYIVLPVLASGVVYRAAFDAFPAGPATAPVSPTTRPTATASTPSPPTPPAPIASHSVNETGPVAPAASTTAPSAAAGAPAPIRPALGPEVRFSQVPGIGTVTGMAMTEDGSQVVLADEPANQLLSWDVAAGQVLRQVSCRSPRHVLCRGKMVYAADVADGTILAFDRSKDWAPAGTFDAGAGVYYLSAAQGRFFDGKIIATCGKPPGRSAVVVNTVTNTHHLLCQRTNLAAATADYQGLNVVLQNEFANATPGGVAEMLRLAPDFNGASVVAIYQNHRDANLLYQVNDTPAWFDGKCGFSGRPPVSLLTNAWFDSMNNIATAPDQNRPVVYTVAFPDFRQRSIELIARRLDDSLAELGRWRVAPDKWLAAAAGFQSEESQRQLGEFSYAFAKPLATTLGDQSHLFVRDHGILYNCNFAAAPLPNSDPTTVPGVLDPEADIAWGLDGKSILLLEGADLRVLSSDGTRVTARLGLPRTYRVIRERAEYFIALSDTCVDLIDRRDAHVLKSIPLSISKTLSLVTSPVARTTYISVMDENPPEVDKNGPKLVLVDEAAGTAHFASAVTVMGTIGLDSSGRYLFSAPGGFPFEGSGVGTATLRQGWRVDEQSQVRPSGRLTFSAFRISGAAADRFEPAQATLIEFDGLAQKVLIADPGAPGRLTLSDVVTMKSLQSRLGQYVPPVNQGFVSFHPFLNLAAVLSTVFGPPKYEVRIVDALTGAKVLGKADLPGGMVPGLTDARRIMFSPDGTHLLMVGREAGGRRVLQAVPLILTPEEAARVRTSGPTTAPATPPAELPPVVAGEAVPAGSLDALGPGDGKTRTLKQIARDRIGVVGVVESRSQMGAVNGTGFFVGASGYLLTTADQLPRDAGNIRSLCVRYVTRDDAGKIVHEFNSPARVARIDLSRNLMLLKIEVDPPMPTVRLSNADSPEAGDRLAAIGSPGTLIQETEFIMGTGTVAGTGRILNGNPGILLDGALTRPFAGAPLFDGHGDVAGVLIGPDVNASDRTAWGIPAKQAREFLRACLIPPPKAPNTIAKGYGPPPPTATDSPATSAPKPAPALAPGAIVIAPGLVVKRTAVQTGFEPAPLIISPDGRRVARLARSDGRGGPMSEQVLYLDNIVTPISQPLHDGVFSPDSAHFGYVAGPSDGTSTLFIDGRAAMDLKLTDVAKTVLTNDAKRAAVVVADHGTDHRKHVIADGKMGPLFEQIGTPSFGRDGQVAYYGIRQGRLFAVRGEKETVLDQVLDSQMPPDSQGGHLGHLAHFGNDRVRLVMDGVPEKPYGAASPPVYSQNGQHWWYQGRAALLSDAVLVIDGVEQPFPLYSKPVFSPDGERYAYFSRDASSLPTLVVNGVARSAKGFGLAVASIRFADGTDHLGYICNTKTGLQAVLDDSVVGQGKGIEPKTLHVSPDGKRLAYARVVGAGHVQVIVAGLDGQARVGPECAFLQKVLFSADGKHVAFVARLRRDDKDLGEQGWASDDTAIIVVDFKEVRCRLRPISDGITFGPDGTLHVLAVKDNPPANPRTGPTMDVERLDISPTGP